jgi:glucose/arabinose dehydrogenase
MKDELMIKSISYWLCCGFMIGAVVAAETSDYQTKVVVKGLDNPWSIAFISNNDWLVTERSGALRRLINGQLDVNPVAGVPDVLYAGQGGLSEIFLHPKFDVNRFVYLSFSAADTTDRKGNALVIVRGRLQGNKLSDVTTIFKSDPLRKTAAHYGARIQFLADGTMLITSGDGFNYREQAQSLDNHFGKLLRLNDDGSIPSDNPFLSTPGALPEIWSYGHRNPQGLIIAKDGTVFEHEHGPKGGDELNIIQPGKNYGWPAITYGVDYSGATISPFTDKPGMEQPIKYWVPSIAPSDMVLYQGAMFPQWVGSLFVSALVPGDVRRLAMSENKVISEDIMFSEFGRIRSIAEAPDGSLILAVDGNEGSLIRVSADSP